MVSWVSTRAQSVTTTPLSTTSFCGGSTITVNYTVSGTFDAKNVFTVQLSAPDGTFSPSFLNIGSAKSITSGTITAQLPSTPGLHYRVRVTSSNPYTVGSDNGTDLTIEAPLYYFGITPSKRAALLGDSIIFRPYGGDTGYTYSWNFGNGALPPSSTDSVVTVTYTTIGIKFIQLTVHSPIGCSVDSSLTFVVYSKHPSIPHDAFIDSVHADSAPQQGLFNGRQDIWVVPGASLGAPEPGSRTIYAEPGATIYCGNGSVIYLKDGANYDMECGSGNDTIIYSRGAGLNRTDYCVLLPCDTLDFDYTNAPPYKTAGSGVRTWGQANAKVSVYPNPASHLVTIESSEIPHSILVRNELGVEMLSDAGPIVTNELLFDVSRFASGVYYVTLDLGSRTESLKFTVSR